jgi:nucleoid DNA-binding protein
MAAKKGKKVVKKPVKKAVKTKKAAVSAKPKSLGKVSEPMTKSQFLTIIAEHTGLARKDVANVFDMVPKIIGAHIVKGAAGMFNMLGLMKVTVVHKPATKARKGINPFTKEEVMFKARPARNVVKIRALKKIKDMV